MLTKCKDLNIGPVILLMQPLRFLMRPSHVSNTFASWLVRRPWEPTGFYIQTFWIPHFSGDLRKYV